LKKKDPQNFPSYSEVDSDVDGLVDELNVKVSMPFTNKPKRVLFLGSLSYELNDKVRMAMKGVIGVDQSSGIGATGERKI
jgi:hypothetical protein